MRRAVVLIALALLGMSAAAPTMAQTVPVGDLGRFQGWDSVALVGYGVVTGLTGTGDSPRNAVTQRAVSNVLGRLGSNLSPDDIRSRNVAAVMVTAVLPAGAGPGDRIDVTVTSIGDARSLAGGVLLMTPLLGADQQAYALSQGAVAVGGYQFTSNQNAEQRNFPTTGVITDGASVEIDGARAVSPSGELVFMLREANVTTAVRIADAVNGAGQPIAARVADANRVRIDISRIGDPFRAMALIEALAVTPGPSGRVVVNERSGTVVAGAQVRLDSVTISKGDIRVSVRERNDAVPPLVYGGFNENVTGLVVSNTSVEIDEGARDAVVSFPSTTIGDLMAGLDRVGVDTRGKIAILQSLKAAGALHADLIIQ